MKEGYSQIRNEALAYAFSYMNLIEHWGSGIPRMLARVKAVGLLEPEFIGGEVDLQINIFQGQIGVNNLKNAPNDLNNSFQDDLDDLNCDSKNKIRCRKMAEFEIVALI